MGKERTAEWYNEKCLDPKCLTLKPLETSNWKLLYEAVLEMMPESKNISIVDLGCGSGRLAKLLQMNGYENYWGVDFSKVRIDEAKRYVPEYAFTLADIFDKTIQDKLNDFDVVVVLEVLEHIEKDLELLTTTPEGKTIILSVPNFNSAAHVRWFVSMEEAIDRYKYLIKIDQTKIVIYPNKLEAYVIKGLKTGSKNV